MPSLPTKFLASDVERQLHEHAELSHLRVRARGEILNIESGPDADPTRHARLRRETVNLWALEVAVRGDRWDPTGYRDGMEPLVTALVKQFGWVLAPRDETPWEPGSN